METPFSEIREEVAAALADAAASLAAMLKERGRDPKDAYAIRSVAGAFGEGDPLPARIEISVGPGPGCGEVPPLVTFGVPTTEPALAGGRPLTTVTVVTSLANLVLAAGESYEVVEPTLRDVFAAVWARRYRVAWTNMTDSAPVERDARVLEQKTAVNALLDCLKIVAGLEAVVVMLRAARAAERSPPGEFCPLTTYTVARSLADFIAARAWARCPSAPDADVFANGPAWQLAVCEWHRLFGEKFSLLEFAAHRVADFRRLRRLRPASASGDAEGEDAASAAGPVSGTADTDASSSDAPKSDAPKSGSFFARWFRLGASSAAAPEAAPEAVALASAEPAAAEPEPAEAEPEPAATEPEPAPEAAEPELSTSEGDLEFETEAEAEAEGDADPDRAAELARLTDEVARLESILAELGASRE